MQTPHTLLFELVIRAVFPTRWQCYSSSKYHYRDRRRVSKGGIRKRSERDKILKITSCSHIRWNACRPDVPSFCYRCHRHATRGNTTVRRLRAETAKQIDLKFRSRLECGISFVVSPRGPRRYSAERAEPQRRLTLAARVPWLLQKSLRGHRKRFALPHMAARRHDK